MFSFIAHIKVISKADTTIHLKPRGQVRKLLFLIPILLTGSIINYGQTIDSLQSNMEHNAYIDLNAFYEPILSNNFYGINLECKGYPFKRFATGFNFSFANRKIDHPISCSMLLITHPTIAYFEFG